MCSFALCCLSAAVASAQTTPLPGVTAQAPQSGGTSKPDKPEFGSHEGEMRARLILKEEKKRYDEHLERAREAAQLAAQLSETYKTKQAFDSEDFKKLERLEKLTKRIRNEAGGSETDPDVKSIPPDTAAAVKRVSEMAEDLRKLVEKTPRHVISAAVIDQANTLIGVIQYVRDSTH
jgi:Mg/Co/Ni transporter MgtE